MTSSPGSQVYPCCSKRSMVVCSKSDSVPRCPAMLYRLCYCLFRLFDGDLAREECGEEGVAQRREGAALRIRLFAALPQWSRDRGERIYQLFSRPEDLIGRKV